MLTSLYMCLAIIAFFALTAHAIQQDERRKAERRQLERLPAVEHRVAERRAGGLVPYLAWAWRTRTSRFRK